MEKNNLGIRPVLTLCPVCAEIPEGTDLTNVEVMWGKHCDKCLEWQKGDGWILVGVDDHKTVDRANPYRIGKLWNVKEDVVVEMCSPNPIPTKTRVILIHYERAEAMKLPFDTPYIP